MLRKAASYLYQPTPIEPLVVFRIAFGGLLFFSTFRMLQKGWVYTLFVEPSYHFHFLPWIQPLNADGMYLVFYAMCVAALGITLGLLYRASTILFFTLFTYVELIDKTYYLNHYYLVSLLVFWMIWVPAHHRYSLDAFIFPKSRSSHCARWHIWIFCVQLSIVYFFAGLAKVNEDWLLRAQPMATWLPGKYHLPLIGKFMHLKEIAFAFSWAGCIYDLFIWVFLWQKRTRGIAYLLVLCFHILTGILFPRIGMFPYIMSITTLIFFSAKWHRRLLSSISSFVGYTSTKESKKPTTPKTTINHQLVTVLLAIYLLVQLYLPMRYLPYGGQLFWHEQGYRFSWRVMLMEKSGHTAIILRDPVSRKQREVNQEKYLTPFQRQQMHSQPDMLLQFANFIGEEFEESHGYAPEIYVKSRLSLNGRRSQVFTNDTLNIFAVENPMKSNWIIPFCTL